MKHLIVLLMALFLSFNHGFSQGLFSGLFSDNSLNKAIKYCKTVSSKEVQNSLTSTSPQELIGNKYAEVHIEVTNFLQTTLSDYQELAKNNSENMKEKKFKVHVCNKESEIKQLTTEYLTKYREYLLEENTNFLDSLYQHLITESILKKYYVKTLAEGVELYTIQWMKDEQEDYVEFLKLNTVHPKIQEETWMKELAKTYFDEKAESFKTIFVYMIQTHNIIKKYGVGSVNIEHESKFNFSYISSLENLLNKLISKGSVGVNKSEVNDLQNEIIKDIKSHIEASTKIQ